MENTNNDSIFDVSLDEQSRSFLLETSRWGKLLSILGIILSAIIILAGLVIMMVGDSFASFTSFKALGPIIGLVYAAFGALYLYPSWKLLRFSSDMPAGLRRGEQHLVTSAFESLKSSFRFWGIFSLVIIGLYVVGIIAFVISSL